MTDQPTDRLSLTDAAHELGVSRPTLYSYEQQYGLPVDRSGGRPCIDRVAFTRWLSTFTPPKTGKPVGPPNRRYQDADTVGARIVRLRATGMTWGQIAAATGLGAEVCRNRFNRWCDRAMKRSDR